MTNKVTTPFTDAEIKAALRHNEKRPANRQERIINTVLVILFLIVINACVWFVAVKVMGIL